MSNVPHVDELIFGKIPQQQPNDPASIHIDDLINGGGDLNQPIIPPGTPFEIPASETSFNIPNVAQPAQIRPTNKVDQLLSTFQQTLEQPPAGQDQQQPVNPEYEKIAQMYPELYPEYVKRRKEGLSDKAAYQVAKVTYDQKNKKQDQVIGDQIVFGEKPDLQRPGKYDVVPNKQKLTIWDKAKDIGQRPQQLIPFISGASDIEDIKELTIAAHKFDQGQADEKDIQLLKNFVELNKKDRSFGYNVLDVISMLPSFFGELYLTGGIYTGAKTAAIKSGTKVLEKLLGEGAEKFLKKGAVKVAGKVAASMAASAAQLPYSSTPRIVSDAMERQLPQMDVQNGKVKITGDGEDLLPAFYKALTNQYVEVASEHSGGIFKELKNEIKPIAKMSDAAQRVMTKNAITRAISKLNPSASPEKVRKVIDRMGWNGILPEMFEERVGEAMRGVATELGLSDEGFKLPTLDQLAVEFVSFAIPGMGLGAINTVVEKLDEKDLKQKVVVTTGNMGYSPEQGKMIAELVIRDIKAGKNPQESFLQHIVEADAVNKYVADEEKKTPQQPQPVQPEAAQQPPIQAQSVTEQVPAEQVQPEAKNSIEAFIEEENKILETEAQRSAPENEKEVRARQQRLQDDLPGYIDEKIVSLEQGGQQFPELQDQFNQQIAKLQEIKENATRVRNNEVQVPPAIPETGEVEGGSIEGGQDQSRKDLEQRAPGESGVSGEKLEEQNKEQESAPVETKEESPQVEQEPEASKTYKVTDIPLDDVNINKQAFQNRESDFSQETVDSILGDIEKKTFKWEKFDPVKLWKNPDDGKLYVLAGHSRLAAFKKAVEKGYTEYNKIPSFIVEGKTFDDAQRFALRESNTLGTREENYERAKIYRDMRLTGKSKKDIMTEAMKNEKKNASTVINLSHLNPKGEAVGLMKALKGTTMANDARKAEAIADYIGAARKTFPELTDEHENEMFKWLMSGIFDKIKNRDGFVNRIRNFVQHFDFDPKQPLNLTNIASIGNAELAYNEKVAEKEKELVQAKKILDDFRKRAITEGIENVGDIPFVKRMNDEIAAIEKELIQLKQQKGNAQKIDHAQVDMFGSMIDGIAEEIKKEGTNDEVIGEISERLAGNQDEDIQRAGREAETLETKEKQEPGDQEGSRENREKVQSPGLGEQETPGEKVSEISESGLKRPEISPLTQSRDAVLPKPDKHKLVSNERYEELERRMQEKLNNLNVGIDPELFAIGTEMAVYQIEEGVIKFTDFSKAMISKFGEKIRPYLKSFYLGARHYPGVDNTEMDTEADIGRIEKEAVPSPKILKTKYHHAFDKLEKGGFLTELQKMNVGDALVYRSSSYPTIMDLHIDRLSKDKFSFAHYFESEGDLVPDPDMEVRIDFENKIIEPISFQDQRRYSEANESQKEKESQIVFLNEWFANNNQYDYNIINEDEKTGGYERLSDMVYERLKSGEGIKNNPELTALAEESFGGTRAQGTFNSSDMYNALEAGINKYLLSKPSLMTNKIISPKDHLLVIQKSVMEKIPTQADRSAEKDLLQQFSTPPTLAYVAAQALKANENDIVLEPSAGTGNLAIFPKATGAKVFVNEIDEHRRKALEYLGFETTDVDAEFLNSLLPKEIRPTAIIMNPPFSATGGRISKNDTKYGFRHLDNALSRLADNGRLVAIMGESAGLDRINSAEWWKETFKKYNVRAIIGIPGKVYQKYGTNFGSLLVIIDKTGSTPGNNLAENLENVVNLSVTNLEDALDAIQEIAQNRPEPTRSNDNSGNEMGNDSGRIPGNGGKGTGSSSGRSGISQPGKRSGLDNSEVGGNITSQQTGETANVISQTEQPAKSETAGESEKIRPGDRGITNVNNQSGLKESGVSFEKNVDTQKRQEEDSGKFVQYQPAKIKGGKKHPANIVESASMAAIEPPDIHYTPNIPKSTIESGKLSNLQLETIAYAGQQHSIILPNKRRAGFFLGDGTGVGKGRQIAGIILDNYNKGRKRAIWVSFSKDLYKDAQRDLNGIDAGHIPTELLNNYNITDMIDMSEGVVFLTYNTLISEKRTTQNPAKRIDQIVRWLGKDGVIIFDESHKAKNALAGEGGEPTKTGQAVLDLQEVHLPEAYVVYSSATGATDVRNMAYMTRLGLWGDGTAFETFYRFMNEVDSGGLGAMEMVARDMKAMGKYMSRSISFEGVEYDEVVHELLPDQRLTYNKAAKTWQIILQNIEAALKPSMTNASARVKALIRAQFWASHQRFFRQMIMSFKVPSLIKQAEKELANGNAIVVGLIGTGESRTSEQVSQATAEGRDLDDIDITPREVIISLIENCFPTTQYIDVQDPLTGKVTQIALRDKKGNIVENPDAIREKKVLLDSLNDLKFPENPLDQVVNHFRPENIAELTGRKKRIIINTQTGKKEYVKRAPEGVAMKDVNTWEMEQFQNDNKKIAIISDAASTGISLHSDKTAKNQRKRVHITLELGWSADKQMQTFGRTHRSNQMIAPRYTLLSTDVGGEKRFSSTIARRLASLGALTKGQQDATGGGDLSKYNFETEEGKATVGAVYNSIVNDGEVPGIENPKQALRDMGVLKKSETTGRDYVPPDILNDISKFLNRILALDLDRQNAMFDYFMDTFASIIENAKANGTFEDGVTDIKGAKEVRFVDRKELRKDEATGAVTEHVQLEADYPNEPLSFDDAAKKIEQYKRKSGAFYKRENSGHYVMAYEVSSRTDATTGRVVPRIRVYRYTGHFETYDGPDFYEKFTRVSTSSEISQVQTWWEKELENYPESRTEEIHLITGIILPYWSKLKETVSDARDTRLRIVRVVDKDGNRFIGVKLPNSRVDNVLRALGINRKIEDPEKIFDTLIEQNSTIQLDKGFRLIPIRLHGDDSIELRGTGLKADLFNKFREMGLINERINFEQRFFIPTERSKGIEIIGKLIKDYPVIQPENEEQPQFQVRYDTKLPYEDKKQTYKIRNTKDLTNVLEYVLNGVSDLRPTGIQNDEEYFPAKKVIEQEKLWAKLRLFNTLKIHGVTENENSEIKLAYHDVMRLVKVLHKAMDDYYAQGNGIKYIPYNFSKALSDAGLQYQVLADAINKLHDQADEEGIGEVIDRFFKERAVDVAWTEEAAKILSKGVQGVTVHNTKEEFDKRLAELGQAGQAKQGAIAFYDRQNNAIYINPDRATKDTIFHEFTHPFINYLKNTDPELYQQGIDLIKGTWYETKSTMERYNDPLDEGLVMAIGEKGAQIQDEVKRNRFIAWLKRVWIKARMAFKKIFGVNLSLDDFVSMMAYQMRSGKRVVPAQGGKIDTQSGAFKRWFGNSKVVDGKGHPMVVYHGTIGDFTEFKLTADIGYHFGTAPQANARIESKDRLKRSFDKSVIPYTNIMSVYLSIQNPLRLDDLSLWNPEDILNNLVRKGVINQLTKFFVLRKLNNLPDTDKWQLLKYYLEDLGYDGIVYKNKHEYDQGRDSWIAFHSQQIKSATGNRGTFDPNNPDIRFQVKNREDQYTEELVKLYQQSGTSDRVGFMKFLTVKGYSPQYVIQAGRDWEVVEDIDNGNEAPGMELSKETIWQGIQRIFQDKYNRSTLVINEARKAGENVTDDINFRLQMELYIGRAADQIEKLEKKLTNGKNGLLERLSDTGLTVDDMGWYLYAKHAKERNRYIKENRDPDNDAGSGLTDDEADDILNGFVDTDIEVFADEFYDLVTRPALKMLYDNALVGEEEFNNYINTYEYYVPLKTDTGGTQLRMTGQHFSVGSRGIIQAKGRHSLAVNPFLQAIMDYESAMIRIEKNKVGQTLLAFVRKHPNPDLWVVTGRRKIPVYNADGEIEFFRNIQPIQDNQFSVWEHVRDKETGQMLTKQKIITIKDELLINGFKNVGAENWNRGIKILQGVNTYLRAVNTVINPEFIITNFERDLQTAMVNLSEVEIKGMKKKVMADIPKAMKGIYKELRGKQGQEWINWFEDFKEQGGKTGWIESLDIEQKRKKFQDKIRFYQKAGKVEQIIKTTGEFIFDLNETVENAVRVATYKNAVQGGMSKAQAASLAKNLTLNFNKKGEFGTVLNTLWLFSNAGIQGGARLLLALKNKKVRKAAAGLILASILVNIINGLIDDDEYEKIPEYVRDTNWIFMLPGTDGKYLMIKLPYGYNVFNVVGNVLADSYRKMRAGVYDYSEFLHQSGRILSSIIDAFNPLGTSGSLGQWMAPTIFDLPLQIAENKNFFGGPIRPEQPAYAPNKPYNQLYFKSVNPITKVITNKLNEWTGGNEFKAGKLQFLNPEDIDHVIQFIGGGLGTLLSNTVKTGASLIQESEIPDLNKVPFVRKFLGQSGEWSEMRDVREMLDESGRTLFNTPKRELFKKKLDDLYDADKIDNTQYNRYLSTFNNAQNRLEDLEVPGTRLAESQQEPKRLVRKTPGVPVPKRELKRPVKKE